MVFNQDVLSDVQFSFSGKKTIFGHKAIIGGKKSTKKIKRRNLEAKNKKYKRKQCPRIDNKQTKFDRKKGKQNKKKFTLS